MLSEETVQIVREATAAFERGDVEAVRASQHDDLITYRDEPDGATFNGKDGFAKAVAEWVEGFDEFEFTATDFIDAGEKVLSRVRQRARGKASGVPIEGDFWFVYSFRDGLVSRIEIFASEQRAGEAAGLAT